MTKRGLLSAVAVLAVARLRGPGTARAAATATVTIDNFSFNPAGLTVAIGTTVTWINHDDIPHTVFVADRTQALRSPVLDTDEAFEFTFATPGTYRYFCSLHPHMQGTVVAG